MNELMPDMLKFRQDLQQRAATVCENKLNEQEQLQRVKRIFQVMIDQSMAVNLEACLRCGMCAEVCHFYEATQRPEYAPVHKFAPLRNFYRREISPMRWLHRFFTPELSINQLKKWQPLIYDACNECGRCDLVCPMGIEISSLFTVIRKAMAAAQLDPVALRSLTSEQVNEKKLMGVGLEQVKAYINDINQQGIDAPLDKPNSSVMLLTTATDILLFKQSLMATAKVLNHLQLDWTLNSHAFEAANYGLISGDQEARLILNKRIIDAAIAQGITLLIVPECGHAYSALRWQAADDFGEPLPFEVLAISELIARELASGKLKLNVVKEKMTVNYQDPCKMGRLGGLLKQPRIAIKALGVELRETHAKVRNNTCCGGGGGVFYLDSAKALRKHTFDLKIKQINDADVDAVVTTCDTCRATYLEGAKQANWDKPILSLVEMVAENLQH